MLIQLFHGRFVHADFCFALSDVQYAVGQRHVVGEYSILVLMQNFGDFSVALELFEGPLNRSSDKRVSQLLKLLGLSFPQVVALFDEEL